MSFLDRLASGVRAAKNFRSVQEAYRLVVHHFHLAISQQSIQETSKHLQDMAEYASVPELAVEYLNLYGRRLIRDLEQVPDDAPEAASQFQRFARKIAELQRGGVTFRPTFLDPFRGIARQLGADPSGIQ